MKKVLMMFLMMSAMSVNGQDITSNLIGHWPLNGMFDDLSSSGYSGTGPSGIQFGNGVNGTANGAAVFGDNSGGVILDHAGLLNLGEDFTISAWVKFPSFTSGTLRIFSSLDVVQPIETMGVSLGINRDGTFNRNEESFTFQVGRNTWNWDNWTSAANSAEIDQWQHIVVTVQGSSTASKVVTFYVDSAPSTSKRAPTIAEVATNWNNNSGSIRIGDAHSVNSTYLDNNFFEGSIAEVRIYGRALSALDIVELGKVFDEPVLPGTSLWSQDKANEVYYAGKVGIGTSTPDEQLTVKGIIHAEGVRVNLNVPGPDYVFDPKYQLTSLEEIKKYILEHKHLPEIPSAKEMEAKGIDLGYMNMLLLKKIEELTLHQIQLLEKLNELELKNQLIMNQLEKQANSGK